MELSFFSGTNNATVNLIEDELALVQEIADIKHSKLYGLNSLAPGRFFDILDE